MDADELLHQVVRGHLLPERTMRLLLRRTKQLLFEQSNVQPVQAPVCIVGDIHGQFYDLLEMFEQCGDITANRFIFMGDFVDRGYHSVETITLIFLLKIKFPDRMVLLRGNHETRWISHVYGFYEEIGVKYGNYGLWSDFNDTFDYLPLAAVVEGSIFCVHGGLSPSVTTIDKLRSIFRQQEISMNGPLTDLMWSDPDQQCDSWDKSPRGAGWLFGKGPLEEFFHTNSLRLLARSHQIAQEGYHKMFKDKLVTVWSAPNYCYKTNNRAAVMKVSLALATSFVIFDASTQSKKLTHYSKTLPYFL